MVSLSSIVDLVTLHEHLEVLIQGLPKDYESFVALINSEITPLQIFEVGALLLDDEARLKYYNKQVLSELFCINLTQVQTSSTLYSVMSTLGSSQSTLQIRVI